MELNTLTLVDPAPAQDLGLALLRYLLNELNSRLFNHVSQISPLSLTPDVHG